MRTPSQRAMTGIGVLLFFGTTMATLAGVLMLYPGTTLDRAWTLNPNAHKDLARFGKPAGIAFLLLGLVLAAAATGWLRQRYWGWLATVIIMTTQVVGDAVNLIRGDYLRGGAGFIIAGSLLFYLLRPHVRAAFAKGDVASPR